MAEKLGTIIKSDVLVLGAGGAGMCAALKAEGGADVLLIDKMGIGWGTGTYRRRDPGLCLPGLCQDLGGKRH